MRSLRDGAILGLLLFASLATQAIALETISANRAAFIASLNVILVPLLGQLLGQRVLRDDFPRRRTCFGWCWGNVLGGWSLKRRHLWMVADVLCYTALHHDA